MRIFPNTAGLMATPIPADIAAEHTAALDTLNFGRVIAALPDVVDQAMRTTLPERYTPELAQQIAAGIVADLHAPHPLTAAQRGNNWMLRFGCTPWCINDHTSPTSPDFHSYGPVHTELRTGDLETGIDDQPWLSAEIVVVNDKAQAYGRETRVLLGYGDHLAELTPAKARQALEAMRDFVTQLETVVDRAARVAKDDFDGDPQIAAADREADDRRIRRITEAAA